MRRPIVQYKNKQNRESMRNVFLLPTPNPSRLIIHSILLNDIRLLDEPYDDWKHKRHLYITSDENPKLDEWGFNVKNNVIFKSKGFTADEYDKKYCKKIILTTDQALISDGVQSIDDEFLEWFVENPSCEWVEVDKNWNYPLDKS